MTNYSAESIRAQLPSSTIATSPEPLETTNNGIARGHALYDSPAPGKETQDLPAKRPRRASKRAQGGYPQDRARSRQRSDRYIQTRDRSRSQSASSRHQSQTSGQTPQLVNDASEMADGGGAPSKSPTPTPTAPGEEAQPRSSRVELAYQLQQRFRNSMVDHSTQELADVLDTLRRDQEDAVQSEESDTEVRVLPPTLVGIGGGFHLNHSAHSKGLGRSNPVTYSSKDRKPLSQTSATSRIRSHISISEDPSDSHVDPRLNAPVSAPSKPSSLLESCPILDLDSPLIDKELPYHGYPLASNPTRLSSEPNTNTSSNTPAIPATEPRSQSDILQHKRPLVRASLSSQSLGDPIPRSPATQPSNLDAAPHPAITLSTTARGTTVTRPGRTGTSSYRTHLNIVSISSQRGPSQTHNVGPVRRVQQQVRNAAPPAPYRSPATQVAHHHAHSLLELLDEDEDDIELASTTVKVPRVAARSHKPTSRDLQGNEYLLWLKVRDVLWAFSIQEGNFKPRSVYRIWFDTIYHQVFTKELPGRDYELPSETVRTVTLNSMATCRGHEKERIRDVVKSFFVFVDPTNDAEREANRKIYDTLWPNSFHCSNPEADTGHYESDVIRRAVTAAFFHSPTAVGAKHPEFFENMEDTIVAYVLTMIQSCVGEWEHGYLQKTKLNADYLHSLYICHYAGLEEAAVPAQSRLNSARTNWFEKSMATIRVKTAEKTYIQPITRREDVRPDTPNVSPPMHRGSSHPSGYQPSTSRAARRFSPFHSPSLAPNVSPSLRPQPGPSVLRGSLAPRPLTPATLRTPALVEDPPNLSPGPESTPERDNDGRYTMHAKGKGPVED